MTDPQSRQIRIGALHALAAYTLWGLLPFYWKMMTGFPLWETLAHRAAWSIVTILLLLLSMRRLGYCLSILRNGALLLRLGVSACCIGANWSLYVHAIDTDQVVQASLGYYINPLVNVALGVFLLRERLNARQAAAVALAAAGVLLMAWEHRGVPAVALGLAGTFALYGLLKKRFAVEPLAGLGAETLWMLPLALGYLAFLYGGGRPHAFGSAPGATALLIGTGAITLAPLFFFNGAARRLPLSTLGFFQYLSPTIQLFIAVYAFGEPFGGIHAVSFGLIWAALSLYSWDAWSRFSIAKAAA